MQIKTNNIPRNLLYGYELTEEERLEFDYMDVDVLYASDFVRYKGRMYCFNDFSTCPDEMKGWDGFQSDSYFSGVVLKIVNNDQVIMGTYFC